jgi:hypothetical protein
MSRNWRSDVPGGPTQDHVTPLSAVRKTVPSDPLTQATLRLTAESPRKWAVLPVGVACHAYETVGP